MYSIQRETAINSNSCALACIVSLCRDFAVFKNHTQAEFITRHQKDHPNWGAEPGGLTPYQFIAFARSYLETKAHVIVQDPVWLWKYWQKPEKLGGVFISQRQPTPDNQTISIQHCWRILDMHKDGAKLMNPKTDGALEIDVDWSFMTTWKAYGIILER